MIRFAFVRECSFATSSLVADENRRTRLFALSASARSGCILTLALLHSLSVWPSCCSPDGDGALRKLGLIAQEKACVSR